MIRKITLAALLTAALITAKAGESGLFPSVEGWNIQEDQRVYTAGDLWELINGAADIFLSYYFQDLHIAEYTNNDRIIRVELYRHSSLANTYGMYSAERMPDYAQVPIGSQGYASQGVLNFMAGNYYVKIMSAGVTEVDAQILALVAEKVDDHLAQPVGLPEELQFLPQEDRVYLSDHYIAQNFLGYSFFRSAFSARYGDQGEIQLFIIRLTPAEIQQMLDQYTALVKEEHVRNKDGYTIFEDPFNGNVFIQQKGNVLVGVLNTQDEGVAMGYIRKVTDNLP